MPVAVRTGYLLQPCAMKAEPFMHPSRTDMGRNQLSESHSPSPPTCGTRSTFPNSLSKTATLLLLPQKMQNESKHHKLTGRSVFAFGCPSQPRSPTLCNPGYYMAYITSQDPTRPPSEGCWTMDYRSSSRASSGRSHSAACQIRFLIFHVG